jgi:hypothetical protein
MMSIHNFLGCLKDLANNSTSILAKNVKFCLFLNLGHIKCRLKPINIFLWDFSHFEQKRVYMDILFQSFQLKIGGISCFKHVAVYEIQSTKKKTTEIHKTKDNFGKLMNY